MRRSWRNGIHWSSYMREMEVKISTTKRSEENREEGGEGTSKPYVG